MGWLGQKGERFMKLFNFYVPTYDLESEIKSYTCVIPESQTIKINFIFRQNHKIYEAECKKLFFFAVGIILEIPKTVYSA